MAEFRQFSVQVAEKLKAMTKELDYLTELRAIYVQGVMDALGITQAVTVDFAAFGYSVELLLDVKQEGD